VKCQVIGRDRDRDENGDRMGAGHQQLFFRGGGPTLVPGGNTTRD
jgi:hypothetical protein